MRTAMQELLDYMGKYDIYPFEAVKNEFLQKEKQQIIDAYIDGMENGFNRFGNNPEYYYEQTYTIDKKTLK